MEYDADEPMRCYLSHLRYASTKRRVAVCTCFWKGASTAMSAGRGMNDITRRKQRQPYRDSGDARKPREQRRPIIVVGKLRAGVGSAHRRQSGRAEWRKRHALVCRRLGMHRLNPSPYANAIINPRTVARSRWVVSYAKSARGQARIAMFLVCFALWQALVERG